MYTSFWLEVSCLQGKHYQKLAKWLLSLPCKQKTLSRNTGVIWKVKLLELHHKSTTLSQLKKIFIKIDDYTLYMFFKVTYIYIHIYIYVCKRTNHDPFNTKTFQLWPLLNYHDPRVQFWPWVIMDHIISFVLIADF